MNYSNLLEGLGRQRQLDDSLNRSMEAAVDRPSVKLFEVLLDKIEEFQDGLEPDQEVGMILANFGREISIAVHRIGHRRPGLLTLYGLDSAGNEVCLLQHVNQVSLMLSKVRVVGRPAVRIGFTVGGDDGDAG